jgi:hypothetical protein
VGRKSEADVVTVGPASGIGGPVVIEGVDADLFTVFGTGVWGGAPELGAADAWGGSETVDSVAVAASAAVEPRVVFNTDDVDDDVVVLAVLAVLAVLLDVVVVALAATRVPAVKVLVLADESGTRLPMLPQSTHARLSLQHPYPPKAATTGGSSPAMHFAKTPVITS